jgi:hypothetical protein
MNTTKLKPMNVTIVPEVGDDERLAAGDCLWGMLVALLAAPFLAGLLAIVISAISVFVR